jgi:hypothetical protein
MMLNGDVHLAIAIPFDQVAAGAEKIVASLQ